MATDNRNSGSLSPLYNPYNPPKTSMFPRAQYNKYGEGNNRGTGDIAVITPAAMGVPKNQTYGMPPTDTTVPPPYNLYNSQFSQAQHDKYETGNTGMGNIAVITPPTMGMPQNQTYEMAPPDYAEVQEKMNPFSDASIRRGFMRKVYLTLIIQLLITVGIVCAFLYWKALRDWARSTNVFMIAMIPATLVFVGVLACCKDLRRKVPWNFMFLGLFTIVEGLMLGSITAFFDAEAVLWSTGATAFVTLSVILFTLQSKWEFTKCSGVMWALSWSLISFGLLCAILRDEFLFIMVACLGTVAYSVCMIFETQLMLCGKYALDPEEYIVAALCLYLSLFLVFLNILQTLCENY